MSAHPPPIPEEQRAPHGGAASADVKGHAPEPARTRDGNLAEQGDAGNIRENTHNQGYTQDR